ncbi:RNAse III [Parasphingorhabdus marina DSM 22363]|uniref:Ribonuclease 3 n=1 Tax=Parasphingorhabdus marina DSM 22363 TaxID=1123272 RepID=A0A1N6FMM9_9SPHN|nr:ribonuclease III [Parasphingorhabdus marina]SIN96512.1 RNAse III [Parasphingorhabdus marina DSM 22363]
MSNTDFRNWITQIVGKAPGDIRLYVRAVTHGSFGEKDYQRLEFLGDRVLGLTIAAELYSQFPNEPEGRLSQRLNGLVSGKTCGEVAGSLQVNSHIRLGKQARDDGARNSIKVLGDVMESLIGAVFLDHGMDSAQAFILKYWDSRISGMDKDVQHPKSALQEWAAAHKRKMPIYELIEKTGPHHDLRFKVQVSVANVGSVESTSSSIQTAETDAARLFLETYA